MDHHGNGLTEGYLRHHCPIAWNTPERVTAYAALGFDIVKTAFAVLRRDLDGGAVSPEEMPVGLRMAFEIVAREGEPPMVRVALAQDDSGTGPVENDGACRRPAEQKLPLDATYMDNHQPINSCDAPMRDAYATLGYAAEVEIIDRLLREPPNRERDRQRIGITVETTKTAGGCAVICVNGTCAHQPHNSTTGGGGGGGS